jgi:alpha-mannosidase
MRAPVGEASTRPKLRAIPLRSLGGRAPEGPRDPEVWEPSGSGERKGGDEVGASGPGEVPTDPPRTLYVVAISHLDTQWRWTVRDAIREFLPRTLREAFASFRAFPSYVLSFDGAFRYMLIKEHYPQEYAELRQWVRAGRWHPAGGMLDAPDLLVPSPESLLRHILYGNRFFAAEFGRPCRELLLPDCFGFGWPVPTVAAHCGLVAFASQKMIKWAPEKIPFDIGVWEGPDGSGLVTALAPDGYGSRITEDLSRSSRWRRRIDLLAKATGIRAGYKFFGVGDRGGAPDSDSLALLEEAAAAWREGEGSSGEAGSDGGAGGVENPPIRVVPAPSSGLLTELSSREVTALPRHRGELLLPVHGTGCLTSQSALKGWNRRNEQRAQAAEAAAAVAAWLGAAPYPAEALREAWLRFLWHQGHDDLTGTSIPEAYDITWNDQILAANRLDGILDGAVGAVARGLDTDVSGAALVVFNPLALSREDIVEAVLPGPGPYRVYGPDEVELPSQCQGLAGGRVRLLFAPTLAPLSFTVFSARPTAVPWPRDPGLAAHREGLESPRYLARVDSEGRLSGLHDKTLDTELLDAPVELLLFPDRSRRWPAWEVLYEDLAGPPVAAVRGPAQIRVEEWGPVRVALEVSRRCGPSVFRERLQLARGDAGDRLEWLLEIDWRSRRRLLKASFPLAVENPLASFDLGLGVARRGQARPDAYEAPAHQWADLTEEGGSRGVSILDDGSYGWDKPDSRTLRLSLLRSPRARWRFRHQGTQDLGRHRFRLAILGHGAGWQQATVSQGARLNQPPLCYRAPRRSGPLGRTLSFLSVSHGAAHVQAVKRAEEGDELVLRLRGIGAGEGHVPPASARAEAAAETVSVDLASVILQARRASGTELAGEEAELRAGRLVTTLRDAELQTFLLRVALPLAPLAPPPQRPLQLPWDTLAASAHGGRPVAFDLDGRSLPTELWPSEVGWHGVTFHLAPAEAAAHCLAARGQEISLEWPHARHLYLLGCAVGEPLETVCEIDGQACVLAVGSFAGPLARARRRGAGPEILSRHPVAWVATHLHDRDLSDQPYTFGYLYGCRLDLPAGATRLTLPREPRLRLFAATLAAEANDLLDRVEWTNRGE